MIDLYRMRQLIRQTVNVEWQIEQERARATKITSIITGMPRGGSQRDQIQDGAIRIAELEEAYAEIIRELEQMRSELGTLISQMVDANNRAAMRLRYIKGWSPKDIAKAIHRTDRSVYYYLSRAEDALVREYPDKVKK